MYQRIKYDFAQELVKIKSSGLYKDERTILSAKKPEIQVEYPAGSAPRNVLNFCANNYLGLANHPKILEAARKALDEHGFGLASVRFICGTQDLHKILEQKIAEFFHTEDTILYSSCFDANGGLFETLLGVEDAVVTDALNHASIIDGIRLCKAKRFIYDHADMASLEKTLKKAREGMDVWDGPGLDKEPVPARNIMIITDGVFSMDGDIAKLPEIVELCEAHGVIVAVDDAHGEGVLGRGGRGIADHFGLHGRVDVEIGTMSKAFGVMGGMAAGSAILVDYLRQKARPNLFSSALTIPDVAANIASVEILQESEDLVKKLWANGNLLKKELASLGFDTGASETPITPVIIGEAADAKAFSAKLFERGVFATAIVFPTVPRGTARIRAMVSAAHSEDDLRFGVGQFAAVGREMGIIS